LGRGVVSKSIDYKQTLLPLKLYPYILRSGKVDVHRVEDGHYGLFERCGVKKIHFIFQIILVNLPLFAKTTPVLNQITDTIDKP